jgi:hypothetical protein
MADVMFCLNAPMAALAAAINAGGDPLVDMTERGLISHLTIRRERILAIPQVRKAASPPGERHYRISRG